MERFATLVFLFGVINAACVTGPEEEAGSTEEELSALVRARFGTTHTILQDAIGYNPRFDTREDPWSSVKPNYAEGIRESQARMIRYPGGTFANYWDYDRDRLFPAPASRATTGWVNPTQVSPTHVGDRIRDGALLSYSLDNLALVAAGNDAKNVVFHMNMVSPGEDFYASADGWNRAVRAHPGVALDRDNPDDWYRMLDDRYVRFRRMLERAKAKGIRVRFVELGNEYYFDHHYISDAFPNGRAHGVAANYIADRVHRDFGDEIRVAAVATCLFPKGDRMTTWNSGLASVLDRSKVGWVTMHAYKTFEKQERYTDTSFRDALGVWTRQTDNKFETSGANQFFLGRERGSQRIWYTETNANWDGGLEDGEGTATSQMKWAQSLADAQSTVHLYDKGNASMLLQFFFNSLVRKEPVEGHLLYNRALAMEPFMRAAAGATSASILDLHDPKMATLPGTDRTVVQGMCFHAEAATRCAIVNLSGRTTRLNLDVAFRASEVRVDGYTSDLDSVDVPRRIGRDTPTTDVRIAPYGVVMVSPK